MLVSIVAKNGSLVSKLMSNSLTIHLDTGTEALLLSKMQPGDHTYARLECPTAKESIKIEVIMGVFKLTRGLDHSTPTTFPTGSCLSFSLTPSHVLELACVADCCE